MDVAALVVEVHLVDVFQVEELVSTFVVVADVTVVVDLVVAGDVELVVALLALVVVTTAVVELDELEELDVAATVVLVVVVVEEPQPPLYAFEPAMTTWKSSQYCPSLVASSGLRSSDQYEHLMRVVDAGFGHSEAESRVGFRS